MKLLIPPPLVALACAGLIWASSLYIPQLGFEFAEQRNIAIVIGILGIAIDIFSVRLFFKNNTTVNPHDPSKSEWLVTTGIYRFTRNPMYVGMALLLIAVGIWFGNWSFVPSTALFILYLTRYQIIPEEQMLRSKFGEAYEKYCEKVRRWI